jgi:GTP cyclohydrolase I
MMKEAVTREEAQECVRKLIQYIGDDPDREGLRDTPDRVIRSFEELYSGYGQSPDEVLSTSFASRSKEMVVMKNMELYSMCEHHMLPIIGTCHIGYIPRGRVIGISKLARIMELYARRLQIQEELAFQIASAIQKELAPMGVGVVIEAQHMCMTSRGVGKQNSVMTSSTLLGVFLKDPRTRAEFFDLI